MLVGINGGNFGSSGAADQVSLGGLVRANNARVNPDQFWQAGGQAIMLVSACNNACAGSSGQGYSSNGVQAINPTTWAMNAVASYQSECAGSTKDCPSVEVLNEPGGHWFWGSAALSQANANAYAMLLEDAYNAFHSRYGAAAPLILASYDGGYSGGSAWGPMVWANTVGVNVNSYVDGVTVHPYGGTGNPTASAQGERASVTSAHTATGKPVWVTEVGWPTDCTSSCPSTVNETGDSLQWDQTQQAANIYNFVTWARSTGYVVAVTIVQYRDDSTPVAAYGVKTASGVQKSAYTALQEAAQGKPCTTCS
jgi:hypothetical protein